MRVENIRKGSSEISEVPLHVGRALDAASKLGRGSLVETTASTVFANRARMVHRFERSAAAVSNAGLRKMNILKEKRGGKIVLTVKEQRLDAHNSGELKDLFLKVLEGESGCDLVIDLDQVQFIDSSGLGALLSGYKNAGLRSRGFVLAGLQPRVRSMFELTRLHRVFDIYPKLEEALSE